MRRNVLVLSRRPDQTVILNINGTQVLVKVCSIKGQQAKVAVVADSSVRILRGELVPDLSAEMLASIEARRAA